MRGNCQENSFKDKSFFHYKMQKENGFKLLSRNADFLGNFEEENYIKNALQNLPRKFLIFPQIKQRICDRTLAAEFV